MIFPKFAADLIKESRLVGKVFGRRHFVVCNFFIYRYLWTNSLGPLELGAVTSQLRPRLIKDMYCNRNIKIVKVKLWFLAPSAGIAGETKR